MNCIEAQKKMNDFLEDKLDITELREFLEHINSCDSCRDDLQIYCVMYSAVKYLDDEKNNTFDYEAEFEKRLQHAEEKVFHYWMQHLRKYIFLLTVILFIILFLS